jgi:hypothetical protein
MDALNPDAIPKFRVHLANGLPTPIQTLDTPGKVSTIMMTNSNVCKPSILSIPKARFEHMGQEG